MDFQDMFLRHRAEDGDQKITAGIVRHSWIGRCVAKLVRLCGRKMLPQDPYFPDAEFAEFDGKNILSLGDT